MRAVDMLKVLIVGHLGQDGTLLRESLAEKNVEVIGVGRAQVDHYGLHGECVHSQAGEPRVEDVIREESPSEIYYLAAEHSSSEGGMSVDLSPQAFSRYEETNVTNFLAVLEAIRLYSPDTRAFYAGSSHVFGPGAGRSLSENSPLKPRSFYAITKAQAMWIARKFRHEAQLHVSTGILFNHESHLRNPRFLSAKVIQGALRVQRGIISEIQVGNLEAKVDWGYARDFVEAFQIVVRQDAPDDYVIATGETRTVREFVSAVFGCFDLDWRDYVREDSSLTPVTASMGRANPSKIFDQTGWRPKFGFEDFVRRLVLDHLSQGQDA